LVYIEQLIKNADVTKYGCIKIIPPASFKPPLAFDLASDLKLPTRFQTLQELGQGKPFRQNEVGYTFQEFADIALKQEGPLKESADFVALE
jgi:hypothetical protein